MNRNRRVMALVILIVGFLLLALIGVLVLRNLGQGAVVDEPGPVADETITVEEGVEQPAVTPIPTVSESDLREVVISIQTLPRGYRITGDELEIEERLATEIGPNVITNPEDIIGLYTRNDVFQGQTLTTDALVGDLTLAGVEDFGPSSLIPFGSVALAVPMDRLSSVAYGLSEGDSIDVMFSFSFTTIDEQFRTILRNSLTLYMEVVNESGESEQTVYLIDPYGRFENQPTGDIVHISPSENQPRPLPVAFILQNAKVIQVGAWTPPEAPEAPTPTPSADGPTPTPGGPPPTATPQPPDVLVIALPPQQQLLLKYAIENGADVDFALRAAGDGQISDVTNVDLNYLLTRFNIEVPPDTNYEINPEIYLVPPTAVPSPGQ